MAFMTVTILYVLALAATCVSSCPIGCSCYSNQVSCIAMNTFPQPFITDATHVKILASHLSELPANAFQGAPNVELISLDACRIGTIKATAFNGTKAEIDIKYSSVHNIEGNAFTNVHVTGNKDFIISSTIIDSIEPFAFNSIQGFANFAISTSTINEIGTNSFYKFNNIGELKIKYTTFSTMRSNFMTDFTNIRAMEILNSSVLNLEPNTLDRLQADLGDSLTISFLGVDCNCGVSWLYNASARSSGFNLNGFVCTQPLKVKNVILANLAQSEVCEKPNTGPSSTSTSSGNANIVG